MRRRSYQRPRGMTRESTAKVRLADRALFTDDLSVRNHRSRKISQSRSRQALTSTFFLQDLHVGAFSQLARQMLAVRMKGVAMCTRLCLNQAPRRARRPEEIRQFREFER